MNDEQKKQVAIFRFGVMSDFVSPTRLAWGERARLIKHKCERSWQIPFSQRTRLSPATIRSWIRAYEKSGQQLESLYPHSRSDRGQPRALDPETTLALIGLRKEMAVAPVHTLIRTAHQRGIVDSEQYLAESTVWRLLKREGLMHPSEHPAIDRRRFEAQLPNDLWQPDVMHGPTVLLDGKNRKTYLIAFIDDMSRLICHAQFYRRENLNSYLDALHHRPPSELRRIEEEERRRARAHRRLARGRRRRVALWFVAGLAVLTAFAFVARLGGVSIG